MTNLTIVLAGIFYCILLRDFDKSKNVQRSSCDEPSKAGGLRRKGSRGMCKKHFYLFKFGKFLYIVRNLCTFTRNNFPY